MPASLSKRLALVTFASHLALYGCGDGDSDSDASADDVDGAGGSDVGAGGSDVGAGGSDVGTGGSDVGAGGSDVGTGGSDVGIGGSDVGTGGGTGGGNPSGEIGNGIIEEGEQCDDGNTTAGDGCDDQGQVEGSCPEPVALVLEAGEPGTWEGTLDSSTSGGGGQLAAATCGLAQAGAGADRVFAYELPYGAHVEVQLTSSADLIVRALDEVCTVTADAPCAAAGGPLDFHAAAGTHYLVVDGATADAKGEFTLEVTATSCSPADVKLTRVDSFMGQRRVTLKNTGTGCSVHTADVGLRLQYGELTSKVDVEMPDVLLAPDQERSVVFGPQYADVDDVVASGEVEFSSLYANVYVCNTTCRDDGTNILDALRSGADGTTPVPSAITFEPALTAINSAALDAANDYVRVAFEGESPTFLASDWATEFGFVSSRVDANGFRAVVPRNGQPKIAYVADPLGLNGNVFTFTGPQGGSGGNHGFDFPTLTPQPNAVLFRILLATDQNFSSGLFFSSSPANDTDGIFSYADGANTYTYFANYGDSVVSTLPIPQRLKWITFEYREIEWTPTSATADIYVNDVLEEAGASVLIGGFGNIRVAAAFNDTSLLHVAELQMR